MRYRLARRENALWGGQTLSFLIGVIIALLLGVVLLQLSGHNAIETYKDMFDGALGSRIGWSKTLTRAVPLGLAGLAVAVAGSMGLWNIGAEGQMIAGAIGAAWVARLAPDLPGQALIPLMMVGGVLGGALLALGPALARARLGVSEIITTLMLNEVALRIVRYLQNGPWKDPAGRGFARTPELPAQAELPNFFGRADYGVVIAALVLAAFGWLAARSRWGYELRIAGSSERAAEYVGISLKTKILTVLLLSGAFGGLAGMLVLAGSDRLVETVAGGWGFAGIIVAALALMRPSGVALVAVAFGAVQIGGETIQTKGVPSSVSDLLQALILFGALTAAVFLNYKLVRVGKATSADAALSTSPADTGADERAEAADPVEAGGRS